MTAAGWAEPLRVAPCSIRPKGRPAAAVHPGAAGGAARAHAPLARAGRARDRRGPQRCGDAGPTLPVVWRDGTTHLMMSPLKFKRRLATLPTPAPAHLELVANRPGERLLCGRRFNAEKVADGSRAAVHLAAPNVRQRYFIGQARLTAPDWLRPFNFGCGMSAAAESSPLAVFWASGWSTSGLDLQRHCRGSPRSRQRLFAGGKRRLSDRRGRTAHQNAANWQYRPIGAGGAVLSERPVCLGT